MFQFVLRKLELTKKQGLLLVSPVLFNFLIYYGGRLIAKGQVHHNLSIPLDAQIPFLPWMGLVYWGCYLFWAMNYYIGVKYDKGNGYRFVGAHFIGETICFLFFVFYPTTMVRCSIPGNSAWNWLVQMTYQVDAANNLFPSIHCFASWLCWIGARNNKHVPAWYQWFSLFMAIAVCISTLTIKQHVFVDVPAGILLAEISYFVSGKISALIPVANKLDAYSKGTRPKTGFANT